MLLIMTENDVNPPINNDPMEKRNEFIDHPSYIRHINDIVSEIRTNIRLFADDSSLYNIVQNPESAALCLNLDLIKISNCAKLWLVSFNYSKNESMVVSRKVNNSYHPPIYMENTEINEVSAHKHLGIFFSNDCS